MRPYARSSHLCLRCPISSSRKALARFIKTARTSTAPCMYANDFWHSGRACGRKKGPWNPSHFTSRSWACFFDFTSRSSGHHLELLCLLLECRPFSSSALRGAGSSSSSESSCARDVLGNDSRDAEDFELGVRVGQTSWRGAFTIAVHILAQFRSGPGRVFVQLWKRRLISGS